MIFVFRQKTPGNIFLLLIFGLLLKMPLFFYAKPPLATDKDGEFYRLLIHVITVPGGNQVLMASTVAFLLLYVQAIMINYCVNEFRMLGKPTYLPAMSYLLLTTLLPEWNVLSAPLVAATFILWGFIKLFRLYNQQTVRGPIFNIGLLLGISSFFYFPAASFLLCFLLGVMVMKAFRLNEMVLFLLGCLTPYYFYAAYLFLHDALSVATLFPRLSVNVPEVQSTVWLAVSTLLLTIPFLLGGFFVQSHLHKMLIQVRKNWSIVLLYLLLAFFVPFVNTSASFTNWILIVVPFACFHAATYFYSSKWVANGLFFLTAGYILYLEYGTVLWR